MLREILNLNRIVENMEQMNLHFPPHSLHLDADVHIFEGICIYIYIYSLAARINLQEVYKAIHIRDCISNEE